jgi:exodeoxyribonuclease-5
MDWSPQQAAAIDAVGRWLRDRERPVFRLWGAAGTGKTTLARHLASQASGEVRFASFSGKAALMMRQRGCDGASTIHSLVYKPKNKSRRRLEELEDELIQAQARYDDESKIRRIQRQIDEERKRLRSPAFELNEDSPLKDASLLVIDEASMVDERVGRDLLRFDVPVLVLGDPFQLPPIYGAGFFTEGEPDAMLTEIHRQAAGDPIIQMATTVREGGSLSPGTYGESRVVSRADFDPDEACRSGAQVIVGRNKTRRRANARSRELLGFPEGEPVAGDRLVCLRNDHDAGLLNGSIWTALQVVPSQDGLVDMEIEGDGQRMAISAHLAPFLGQDVPFHDRLEAQEMDYGYALTCHKAQGSEFPEVLVVDESRCFGEAASRWIYTAITRAINKVTVVL